MRQIVVPLDDTGVRDLDYQNLRNPPYVFGDLVAEMQRCSTVVLDPMKIHQDSIIATMAQRAAEKSQPPPARASTVLVPDGCKGPKDYATARVEFVNVTADRDIRAVLRVPLHPRIQAHAKELETYRADRANLEMCAAAGVTGERELALAKLTALRLLKSDACATKGPYENCEFTFTLLRGGAQHADLADLVWLMGLTKEDSDKRKPVQFEVSFLRDDEKPTNAKGTFTVVPLARIEESSSGGKISITASIKGTREPALGIDDAPLTISEAVPYAGAQRDHFPASGRIVFEQTLGNRADANVEVAFKGGDQGNSTSPPAVTLNSYQVNVYSLRGVQLRVGRTDFGKSLSNVAAAESGDGFRLSYGKFSLGHVMKREGKDKVSNDQDVDNSSLIAQLSSVRLPEGFGMFRAYSVLAIAGRERDPLKDHLYRTIGGDTSFRMGAVRGNLAGYWSWTKPRIPGLAESEGKVGLLSLYHSVVTQAPSEAKGTLQHSVAATFGYGTGNRPSTEKDEGYLGETASFAPDLIFLAGLAKRIDTGGAGSVGAGLSNKRYAGVTYTNAKFSPLRWVAKRVGATSDIQAESTLIQWHGYWFNEPVRGKRHAGHELDLKMFVETPQGVIVELSGARFFPGAAIKKLFNEKPWLVYGSITVKL